MVDIKRIVTNPRRGRAIVHNGTVFIGGQAAADRSQDAAGQTRQILANIDKVLAEAGSDRQHLLSVQIWLKDIGRDFASMNAEWDGWIDHEHGPARATAQCEMGADDVLVEILVTAAVAS
ncbi:RidA family protein [Sphingomonas sp. PAMC 26617]|uniref:RidA family protein n=1 Tax=Sphingomonas sp. PAMC 26617 TaxID=1112216 RepID=UPI000289A211|nr:RidA family protein [Sphingomonas sp. PAMC 26617]